MAMASELAMPSRAATCAFILRNAMQPSSTTTGTAAVSGGHDGIAEWIVALCPHEAAPR